MRARALPSIRRVYLHIDWSESTVGDATADGTSKGESGVEGSAGKLAWLLCCDGILHGIELGRAGRRWWGLCGHNWQCVRGDLGGVERLVVGGRWWVMGEVLLS